MFGERFVALFAALLVGRVHAEPCWADNPTHWGNGELTEVEPSQCCYFCHRFYGQCGECRIANNATQLNSCVCDKPLNWKWEDQGPCNPNEEYYIPNCLKHCKSRGHPKGECQFTWATLIWWTRMRCMCRVIDDAQPE